MSKPPDKVQIVHITHVDNLASMVAEGALLSDRVMVERGGPNSAIGMWTVKQRRLERCPVACHPGTMVGDYVPFFFWPRSVMLFLLYKGNHPELTYRGGQGPIVHLVAPLNEVVAWADAAGTRWCFNPMNASTAYARDKFRTELEQLDELDWAAIRATDFRDQEVKERKQAEFLVHERFPLDLVRRVGVQSAAIGERAASALSGLAAPPRIEVQPTWYF